MNFNEIDWDIENAGRWPLPIKALLIGVCSLIVIGAWYYYDTQAQIDELDQVTSKEAELRTQFEAAQKKAANLDAYKSQLAEIERIFGDMLRQLPNKTQVPELLVDVSQTGLASGLEFELFKPVSENKKDFYAELPIDIRVVGTYEKFSAFVSGLASLPRIVTIHDVRISQKDASKPGRGVDLVMDTQVKTYRYLDELEVGAIAQAPKAGGK